MEKNIDFADIIKTLIGDKKYLEFLTKIAKENGDKNIPIDEFYKTIFNQYCFIILTIGFSKKVEVDKYKLKTSSCNIELSANEVASEYEEYIKLIENKKFEWIRKII